ncbi:hypothetical protein RJT34_17595 [Clitoria ternatea]|uniref:Uncharacterized protein n=1 Tax=Clitoria ternatea TaxID=43366 RepID=A0AAN9J989_CLITE
MERVSQIIHALCYFCKTWCLGANGVTCMIDSTRFNPSFLLFLLFWFDNVESKLFSSPKLFIKAQISCS